MKLKYINSMLELIGNTPLLKLNKVAKGLPANVFVKLELLNPSGSYKDRMALAMIEAAEKGLTWNGKKLRVGGTVCDASAGNTAPALAFVCAVKGYRAKLCCYQPMLRGESTRLKITSAYGAETYPCAPPSDYIDEKTRQQLSERETNISWVISGKKQMYDLESNDQEAVWVDQIYNKYNYIGQMQMGYEIYDQLDGKVDAWGCSVGSGASLLGVTLALREKNLKPFTFGIEPSSSNVVEVYTDIKGSQAKKGEFGKSTVRRKIVDLMNLKKWQSEKSIVEQMLEFDVPDEFYKVTDEEARATADLLCREEGIWCGMSSGANVHVALKIAQRMKPGENVVTVIVDRRDRYLGEYPNDIYVV